MRAVLSSADRCLGILRSHASNRLISYVCAVLVGAVTALFLPAWAQPARQIAVIHNATVEDSGFNSLILDGVRRFETQRATKVRIYGELEEQFNHEVLMSRLDRPVAEGVDAVVFGGFDTLGRSAAAVAQRFPKLKVVALDAFSAAPDSVQTVQFRFEEAAFLAGIVAARSTRSGVLGFVGGMDVPAIRSFGCAYAQGALQARPELMVLALMVGRGVDAFSNPAAGRERAQQLLREQADVIFAAAGASGLGVLAAAAEAGVYGIGVDANQNGLHPGHVLTSVLKRMDVAVYTSLVALADGTWKPGTQSIGLAEGAVGLAMDEHNLKLISDATRQELQAAEFDIISDAIVVATASAGDGSCAFLEFNEAADVAP